MSEPENYDELITGSFASFTVTAAPWVRAAGTGDVRMTVDRRRKVRFATFSVLGALLIAVPVVVFAASLKGDKSAPGPADTPTPGVTATVSPSPSAQPPDGRITLEQLMAVPIEVPGWKNFGDLCPPAGAVQLKTDTPTQGTVFVKNLVHTNLDGDDALETAAQLVCRYGDPSPEQVVAYDHDALGQIVLLGRIYGIEDDVDYTRQMQARPGGGLIVSVCVGGCGSDPDPGMYKDREYVWDGSKFARAK